MFKYYYNNNKVPQIYFWRDIQGHEIDAIIEKSYNVIVPIEVKAGMTVTHDFFKGLVDWKTISEQSDIQSYVVYGGAENLIRSKAHVYSWSTIDSMLDTLFK